VVEVLRKERNYELEGELYSSSFKLRVKKMRKLNGRRIRYECPVCEEQSMLLIINHQPYCMECNGKVVYALENEYYSVSEFACSHCGLVIEPSET